MIAFTLCPIVDFPGTVVFVTHDRVFLQRLATRIVELDRGKLTSWPGNYPEFLRKKEEWLANEALQREKFDTQNAAYGAVLLFVYGLGSGIPIVLGGSHRSVRAAAGMRRIRGLD